MKPATALAPSAQKPAEIAHIPVELVRHERGNSGSSTVLGIQVPSLEGFRSRLRMKDSKTDEGAIDWTGTSTNLSSQMSDYPVRFHSSPFAVVRPALFNHESGAQRAVVWFEGAIAGDVSGTVRAMAFDHNGKFIAAEPEISGELASKYQAHMERFLADFPVVRESFEPVYRDLETRA